MIQREMGDREVCCEDDAIFHCLRGSLDSRWEERMSSIAQEKDVTVFRAKCRERGAGDDGEVDEALGRGFSDLKYYTRSISSIHFMHTENPVCISDNLQQL